MIVCGIDEAGRGPLAGPVTAAAVILPPSFRHPLADSKKLSPSAREKARVAIMNDAVDWAVGWVWPEEIDRINIHRATLLAMTRAYRGLSTVPDLILVDGKFVPPLRISCKAVIGGDSFVPEIQAASILAKTVRDRWMERYSWIEPGYGFERHKGYPTKEHREACSRLGLSAIHRRSFRISDP